MNEEKRIVMEIFGQNLLTVRKLRGISQAALAEYIGYTGGPAGISRIEKGISEMSYSRIVKAAEILDVPPAILCQHRVLTEDQVMRMVQVGEVYQDEASADIQQSINNALELHERRKGEKTT